MKYRLLRILLFVGAFGWGVSAIGIFVPWETAVTGLQGLGAGDIPADPMLNYWLRMAAGAFTGIGGVYFITGLWPKYFSNIIGILGILSVGEGIVLLVHGLRLGLRPFPFYGDVSFCLLIGTGIWALKPEAQKTEQG